MWTVEALGVACIAHNASSHSEIVLLARPDRIPQSTYSAPTATDSGRLAPPFVGPEANSTTTTEGYPKTMPFVRHTRMSDTAQRVHKQQRPCQLFCPSTLTVNTQNLQLNRCVFLCPVPKDITKSQKQQLCVNERHHQQKAIYFPRPNKGRVLRIQKCVYLHRLSRTRASGPRPSRNRRPKQSNLLKNLLVAHQATNLNGTHLLAK